MVPANWKQGNFEIICRQISPFPALPLRINLQSPIAELNTTVLTTSCQAACVPDKSKSKSTVELFITGQLRFVKLSFCEYVAANKPLQQQTTLRLLLLMRPSQSLEQATLAVSFRRSSTIASSSFRPCSSQFERDKTPIKLALRSPTHSQWSLSIFTTPQVSPSCDLSTVCFCLFAHRQTQTDVRARPMKTIIVHSGKQARQIK